jgi:hypothetical protein
MQSGADGRSHRRRSCNHLQSHAERSRRLDLLSRPVPSTTRPPIQLVLRTKLRRLVRCPTTRLSRDLRGERRPIQSLSRRNLTNVESAMTIAGNRIAIRIGGRAFLGAANGARVKNSAPKQVLRPIRQSAGVEDRCCSFPESVRPRAIGLLPLAPAYRRHGERYGAFRPRGYRIEGLRRARRPWSFWRPQYAPRARGNRDRMARLFATHRSGVPTGKRSASKSRSS